MQKVTKKVKPNKPITVSTRKNRASESTNQMIKISADNNIMEEEQISKKKSRSAKKSPFLYTRYDPVNERVQE